MINIRKDPNTDFFNVSVKFVGVDKPIPLGRAVGDGFLLSFIPDDARRGLLEPVSTGSDKGTLRATMHNLRKHLECQIRNG